MSRARISIDRDFTVAAAGNQLTLTLPALSRTVVELEAEKA